LSNLNETPETTDPIDSAIEAEVEKAKNATTAPPTDTVTIPRAALNYVIIAVVFFAVGAVMGSFVFPSTSGQAVTAELPDNFEVIVREAVADALGQAGIVEEPGLVMGERYELPFDISDDPFRGNEDAPVVIVEFSDFTCGFCGRFAMETLNPLVEEYGDQVKLVYMDFPFLSQMSAPTSIAAECAHQQDAFWEYHDTLFTNQRNLTQDGLVAFADELGLDVDAFNACLEDEAIIEQVRDDLLLGRELGVSGTPAFFVNGRFVSGAQPLDVFRQYIDEELAAATDS
jgi:protein-disulfide isomerase